MEKNLRLIVIWVIIGIIIWYLISKLYFQIKIRWQRKNAIERSKHVLIWQVNEKIAPILPGFPYNYKDLVFIWKWIDYIVFDWLSVWYLKKIVFLEIKSWISSLNRNEMMVKNCVESKKISYEVVRIKK